MKIDGCRGVKVFVGSSTGTLLVSNHEDIKKNHEEYKDDIFSLRR